MYLNVFIVEVVVCSAVELDHIILGGDSDILPLPFTNMKSSSTPPLTTTLTIISFVKVEYVVELLYCIALACTDVPNKAAREFISLA